MVFFTCNACGSSLKKNQVEKHYQNECRNCSVLSCMDCGQDFYGDDYVGHTKCVSEAEKYQGAMFKGNSNKGDKKQQEWLQRAHSVIQGAKVGPRISALLEKMLDYPNIPRKKAKFENFIRNSLNVRDQNTLDKLWSIFSRDPQPSSTEATDGTACAETKPSLAVTKSADRKEESKINKKSRETKDELNREGKKDEKGVSEDNEEVKKKSKKKRKRDVEVDDENRGCGSTKKRPKGDKDQIEEVEIEHDMEGVGLEAGDIVKPKKMKKKKTKKKSAMLELKDNNGETVTESDSGILSREETNTATSPAGDEGSGNMENQLIKRKKKKKKKEKEKDLSTGVDNCEPAAEQTNGMVAVEDTEDGLENGTCWERVHKSKKKKRKHLATLGDNEGGGEVKRLRMDTGEVECVENKTRKSQKLRTAKEAVGCNGEVLTKKKKCNS